MISSVNIGYGAILVILASFLVTLVSGISLGQKPSIRGLKGNSTPSGPAAATGRVMSKKYSWELDEKATLAKSSFPIKPTALIERAKQVIDGDLLNPDDFSEEFVFQFPYVGPLSKAEYLKAVSGFKIKTMFPDLNSGMHNFHVDPMRPNRVWFMVDFVATHSGEGPFGKPTGIEVECPPQVNSLTFDAKGKVIKYTGGYVVDKDIGNSGGMGGIFGPLYAIGKGFPFPEGKPYSRSWQFKLFSAVGGAAQKASSIFGKKDE